MQTNACATLRGISASPGVVIGKIFLLHDELHVPRYRIEQEQTVLEWQRLKKAAEDVKRRISEISDQLRAGLEDTEVDIFQVHVLMLEDPMWIERIRHDIENKRVNAEAAVVDIGEEFIEVFSSSDDRYFNEKAADVRDVIRHLIYSLTGHERTQLTDLAEDTVLVAHDLTPSDTVGMRHQRIVAFATDAGSRVSHTAILARSLGIPAVVGLHNITEKVQTGDLVILDGNHGLVILCPTKELLERYHEEQLRFHEFEQSLGVFRDQPSITLDSHAVALEANIEFPDEIRFVSQYGAEGIGLYRTEYFYIGRTDLPSEDELFEDYRYVAESLAPQGVTIRTLDLGGDKLATHLGIPSSMNNLMGLRAIRLCLKYPEIFRTQLRAILRASVYGRLRMMFPMISGVEELREALLVYESVKAELREREIPFDAEMKIGAMVELPSAAMTADILARELDFLSLGTNDLIQYALGVDRGNEEIASLFQPFHPSVLRFIKYTVDAAHKQDIPIAICGEMAGDPVFALLLLGLGLDSFSMSPSAVPEIKHIVRSVHLKEALDLAEGAMTLSTAGEIEEFVWQDAMRRFPELLNWDYRA